MNRVIILVVALAAVCSGQWLRSSSMKDRQVNLKDRNLGGQWLTWSLMMQRLPYNAVHAGTDHLGASFVIRAEHTIEGDIRTKIVGRYYPRESKALIGYGGKVFDKKDFELLVHDGAFWSSKYETRTLVPGFEGYICRIRNGEKLISGRLDADLSLCHVAMPYGEREITSPKYEALREMC